jgi:DNA repair protein RadC
MGSHINVKQLPESERPYEKFFKYGVESLSDAELLAIIIKSGTRESTSLEVARGLLSGRQGNLLNLYDFSYDELLKFSGVGKVKAIQLKTVAELSKRIARTNSGYHISMTEPATIADYYMEQMRHLKKEFLICAFFDAKCNFIGDAGISIGSTSYAYVSPKDILRTALERNASLIVLLHNHPSGDPAPSSDDIRVTDRIRKGAQLLDLKLCDHIIIGDNRYFSFAEHGM